MKTSKSNRMMMAAAVCATGFNLHTLANELDRVTPVDTTAGGSAPATVVPASSAPAAAVNSNTAFAPAGTAKAAVVSNSSESVTPDYLPFSISPEVGTTGAGGTASWRFSDHFGLCAGGDYFSHSLFNNRTISGVSYSGDFTLQSENAGLRYYPSQKSSFYVYVGALFNQNVFNGTASGNVEIDGVTYPVPANEPLTAEYKQQPVCPEVAIGGNFFYFDKGHHCAFGGELGVFYLGEPKLTINSSYIASQPGGQAALASYQSQAESDLKKVPVWPVLKLQITFNF